MHAGSRESLAAARDRLDTYADRARAVDLDAIAAELFAVVDLLDREPAFRRLLSDSAVAPDARVGLLDRAVGERLGPRTLDQLRPLVAARWSHPGDLADAVEAIAQQAALAVAERGGALDEVEDELFRFGRILAGQPELRSALAGGRAPVDRRVDLLDRLIEGKVQPTTRRLLEQVVRSPRGLQLDTALTRLVELAAERRERYVAYVRAAAPLTAEQEQRLAAALRRIYGREMDLQVEVDPELLGGLVIRVKDEVIDGSVARRLDAARQRLAG